MKTMEYLETLGFINVTEQIKAEIKSNAKITKKMEYVLEQIDKYELKLLVNPEHIGEKNVIFFERYRANFKYISEVIKNKTTFTTQLPEKIQQFEKIYLDEHSVVMLNSKETPYSIETVLEAWEFFLTGNSELPHYTKHYSDARWANETYEYYPKAYREEFRKCN